MMTGCVAIACALLSAAPKTGFVTTPDGARLHYEIMGRGPAVIVPAGFIVRNAFAPLADRYRLIFYDMRNRGRSSPVADSTTLTVRQDVRDLETLRAALGVERTSLVGFSYLGLVVALYAAEHPERVERVVQIGPVQLNSTTKYPADLVEHTEPVDSAAWDALQKARRSGEPARAPRAFCEQEWQVLRVRLVGDQSHVNATGPSHCDLPNELPPSLGRHFRFNFSSVQALRYPMDSLRRVTMPVLTIHGTRDRNAPYGSGREWAMRLPNARLLTVEGAAHMVWADAPDIVLGAMRAFLGGAWPAEAERVTALARGPAAGDSAAVTAVIDSVLAAGSRADTLALFRLYDPAFFHTNANGSVLSRESILAVYRTPRPAPVGVSHDEDHVVSKDGAAILSTRVTVTTGTEVRRFRVSYFLAREAAGWRVLSSHASVLQEDGAAR